MEDIDLDNEPMQDLDLGSESDGDDAGQHNQHQEYESTHGFNAAFDSTFDDFNPRGDSCIPSANIDEVSHAGERDSPIDMDTQWWKTDTPLDEQEGHIQAQQNARSVPMDASIFGAIQPPPAAAPLTKSTDSSVPVPPPVSQRAPAQLRYPVSSTLGTATSSMQVKEPLPAGTREQTVRDSVHNNMENISLDELPLPRDSAASEEKSDTCSPRPSLDDEQCTVPSSPPPLQRPQHPPQSSDKLRLQIADIDSEDIGKLASPSAQGDELVGNRFGVTLERGEMGQFVAR